jgi:Uma2 family endonuclease
MLTVKTALPTLESGDHLSREEFHRRYRERPDLKKAELVEGVVYVPSPVSAYHAEPDHVMAAWLVGYRVRHPGVHSAGNVTVQLDGRNEVQPDSVLWREIPGGPHLRSRGYLQGAPQLVVEVAASSASYDLHEKKQAYERNGVGEYIVWRVFDERLDWFRLVDGRFEAIEPDPSGIIASREFPGLRLHVAMLLAGDIAGVLAELDR